LLLWGGCVGNAFPLTDNAIAELLQTVATQDDAAAPDSAAEQGGTDGPQSSASSADAPGSASSPATGDSNLPIDVRLRADLRGRGEARGHADYRVEGNRRSFKIEVEHFPPGEYAVLINGVEACTISVGAPGLAEIEFDSKSEPGPTPFPDGFPAEIRTGDTVEVLEIVSGPFAPDD
jgi:hypothetical protein